MRTSSRRNEGIAAIRCAQVCAVSLATFVTSGLGLLSYSGHAGEPAWLRLLTAGAGGLAVIGFVAWLLLSAGAIARDYVEQR